MTFVFGPFYVTSRVFHVLLPCIIPFMLTIEDFEVFQMVIWIAYMIMLVIWSMGTLILMKDEYYLWHILPIYARMSKYDHIMYFNEKTRMQMYAEYQIITTRPIVERMIVKRYGADVANIILMYCF